MRTLERGEFQRRTHVGFWVMILAVAGIATSPIAAQEPMPMLAPETLPNKAVQDFYRAGDHGAREVLESAPMPVDQGSGLPLPESWTNTMFNPQPRLDIRMEVVWLQPNFDNSFPLATQVISRGAEFERTPVGIRGETENIASPKGTVEYHWNEQGSIEFSGFSMNGPDQSNYRLSEQDQTYYFDGTAANSLEQGFLYNAPPDFPLVVTDASLDWSFRTYGGEINLLHHCIFMRGHISDFAIGMGGRYIGVSEDVTLRLTNEVDATYGQMSVQSRNNVAGPQFVMRARVNGPTQRLRWIAEGKIGLMANGTQYTNSIQSGSTPSSSITDSTTVFSPLFEGLFGCELYLWKNVVVYGGYQLLYMNGVDRAGGHFSQDIARFSQPEKHLGDLFLYGPRLGMLVSF